MLKYALPVAFMVSRTAVYRLIQRRLDQIIPFNHLIGVEVSSVGDGVAEARLPFSHNNTNHIGSVHATAIFGVAEAASGGAMSGAFAPYAASIRPVAASSTISFIKLAKTELTASAKTSQMPSDLREHLLSEGKVVFDVDVEVRDSENDIVSTVKVTWHVSKKR